MQARRRAAARCVPSCAQPRGRMRAHIAPSAPETKPPPFQTPMPRPRLTCALRHRVLSRPAPGRRGAPRRCSGAAGAGRGGDAHAGSSACIQMRPRGRARRTGARARRRRGFKWPPMHRSKAVDCLTARAARGGRPERMLGGRALGGGARHNRDSDTHGTQRRAVGARASGLGATRHLTNHDMAARASHTKAHWQGDSRATRVTPRRSSSPLFGAPGRLLTGCIRNSKCTLGRSEYPLFAEGLMC